MTRRDAFKLLSVIPLTGLVTLESKRFRSTVDLHWDWEPASGEPVSYFEVFVTAEDGVPHEDTSTIMRTPGDVRRCTIALPNASGRSTARVRAVNAHGRSEFSAPILLTA
jgi:hypothetical protein